MCYMKLKKRSKLFCQRGGAKDVTRRPNGLKRKRPKPEKEKAAIENVYDPNSYITRPVAPLQADEQAKNWWDNEEQLPEGIKWVTLRHNGVLFPPKYEPHGKPVKYEGVPVKLSPEAEEAATFFAVIQDSDNGKNPIFRKNFFNDWKKLLPRDTIIKDMNKVDFTGIALWYAKKKEKEKESKKDPAVKQALKDKRAALQETYGYAIIDGVRQKVGNYMVEIPGLFRGRGEHPKTGMIKKRIMPEDIILNIGENEKIPESPLPGHNWGGITHNQAVTYIAKWNDPITGSIKMVFLHASSRFKGENDRSKYEKARLLKTKIDGIRRAYESELTPGKNSRGERQRATAVWIIDRLAIRVGNEKDTDETADTVGVCTLRVEHLTFKEDNRINLRFLGKDSMEYNQTMSVTPIIYANLVDFCKGKKPLMDIFDAIKAPDINEYLTGLMPGLTAKVFRTYNASSTLEKELNRTDETNLEKDDLLDTKKYFYDEANRHVAILCNHQKSLSKSHGESMQKLQDKLKDMRTELRDLKSELKEFKEGSPKKKKQKKNKEPEKRKRSEEQLKKAIHTLNHRIQKAEVQIDMKEKNSTVALGTSKINYMDPRVSVAWCKRVEMPIEKIFQSTLLDKFPWAMNAEPNFKW